MKKMIHYLCLILLIATSSVSGETFKAGAALRIITPDPLLPVSGGVGIPNPVTEKKGELFIRTLVLEKGDTRVAIVCIDNLGFPAVLGDKVRELVEGIPPENILIGATHTHSAPDAYGFADEKENTGVDLGGGIKYATHLNLISSCLSKSFLGKMSKLTYPTPLKYLDWCVGQMAEAVDEAVKKLEPAVLKIAVGEAKGKIAYNYYAEQLYDPRCGVIQAIASTGKNKDKSIATLVNYAIHPEVIGSEQGILSPDLCGPLYDRIESRVGGVAIFMNSALGGMVTADNRLESGGEARTWEECIRIGTLLADEALQIIENADVQKNPGLFCTERLIELPIDSKMMRFILKHSALNYILNNDFMVTTRLNLLNIGTAQILTIPGEALPNIGYYLKRNMKTNHPFLFGLTNDAFGYIMTKVDFNSFKRYDYITRTSLGEMTGEIFIEQSLGLINTSPGADGYSEKSGF